MTLLYTRLKPKLKILFTLDRSRDRSSDSEAAPTGPAAEKRRSRLSVSSSDDERPATKNTSASDEELRWRRAPSKRSKNSESPTKKSEKKKNPVKSKSRRPSSRVPNTSGCASDSDSDAVVNPKLAERLNPRARTRSGRTSSMDDSDSDDSSAPNHQEEDAGNVQDKKKSDTIRRLFSSAKGGAKGGGKGGKGGKGGGKCGIYVEEYTGSANTPTCSESPYRRPSSRSSTASTFPPLVYLNGVPSLLCRLDLSKIPHVPQPSRGQELRQRTELPDTRPASRPSSRTSSRPSSRTSRPTSGGPSTAPRPSTPEEGEIIEPPRPHSSAESRTHGETLKVKPETDEKSGKIKRQSKSERVETEPKRRTVAGGTSSGSSSRSNSAVTNTNVVAGGSGNGANVVPPAAGISGSAPKRKRNRSCSSVSSISVCSVDVKGKHSGEHKEKKKRRKKHGSNEGDPPRSSSSSVSFHTHLFIITQFMLTSQWRLSSLFI